MLYRENNEALGLRTPYRQLHWAYLVTVNAWLLLSPDKLLHDYRMNAIPLITSIWDLRNLVTLLFTIALLAVTALCVYRVLEQKKKLHTGGGNNCTFSADVNHSSVKPSPSSILLVGILMLTIPFIPASNLFFPVGFVVAERILYLPSMGLCLVVGYSAYKMIASKRRVVSLCTVAGLFCLLSMHSAKTVVRNGDWHSELSLHSSLIRHYPTSGHVLVNIAREYREIEDFERAELVYRYAAVVAPDIAGVFVNFGSMLKNLKRFEESEKVRKV